MRFKARDIKVLSSAELAELATRMLDHIGEQSKHIDALDERVDSQARGIEWRDAKTLFFDASARPQTRWTTTPSIGSTGADHGARSVTFSVSS